jgi:hypothetical protein
LVEVFESSPKSHEYEVASEEQLSNVISSPARGKSSSSMDELEVVKQGDGSFPQPAIRASTAIRATGIKSFVFTMIKFNY